MKILFSWLRELVAVSDGADEVAAMMSVRGFAVEGIERLADGDAILDFEITANRPDCLSVLGMAREVAAAYQLPLTLPEEASLPLLDGGGSGLPRSAGAALATLSIAIEDPDLCPRYAGALAQVRVGPSPEWMQLRLRAAGIRPISNVVDVTNYVLVELGQPMHAFDAAKLSGGSIHVRRARPGETIRTLDGVARSLGVDRLVIADDAAPVAIGGVMGGAETEVSDTTTAVLLESAYFDPLSVRRSSKALGLKTEASTRFERGADPAMAGRALARACALLEAIGAGATRGPIVDVYPVPIRPQVLRLRPARIAGVLGLAVDNQDVHRILTALGFDVVADPVATVLGNEYTSPGDGWDVTVPTRRVDVRREIDLIEELARHVGFDRIPSTFPVLAEAPPPVDPRIDRARCLRALLTGVGFFEAVTFGFLARAAAAPFAQAEDIAAIANPLAETFGVLRPSLVPGLVAAVGHNRRRERRDVRVFEIGARFSARAGERQALACAWAGDARIDHWSGEARAVDFFDMKGAVERITTALGITTTIDVSDQAWLTPGRAAAVFAGSTAIGAFGQLRSDLADAHGMSAAEPVYVAELDLDAIETHRPSTAWRVEPLPRHPSVARDMSILVDDALPAARVRETIQAAGPATLAGVREFDRYQGAGIPTGKVSLSLRLTFRAPDRTLTDGEVDAAMALVVDALARAHHAIRR